MNESAELYNKYKKKIIVLSAYSFSFRELNEKNQSTIKKDYRLTITLRGGTA